jgi:hypothetical protein
MDGDKLAAVKQALCFLVQNGLQSNDQLGLVSFDEDVTVRHQLVRMNQEGRHSVLRSIEGMAAQGKTNISNALVEGVRMLVSKKQQGGLQPAQPHNTAATDHVNTVAWSSANDQGPREGHTLPATRAIFLMTDCKWNRGVKQVESLLRLSRGIVTASGCSEPPKVFAFGLGADHNDSQLRALADGFSGRYIDHMADIRASLSACISDLIPSVAHDATLVLDAAEGASTLTRPLQGPGGYLCTMSGEQLDGSYMRCEVAIGDIWSTTEGETAYHLLVPLRLPRLAMALPESRPVLTAKLVYSQAGRVYSSTSVHCISRPALVPPADPGRLPISRNRARLYASPLNRRDLERGHVGVAIAVEEATCLAGANQFEAARRALTRLGKNTSAVRGPRLASSRSLNAFWTVQPRQGLYAREQPSPQFKLPPVSAASLMPERNRSVEADQRMSTLHATASALEVLDRPPSSFAGQSERAPSLGGTVVFMRE